MVAAVTRYNAARALKRLAGLRPEPDCSPPVRRMLLNDRTNFSHKNPSYRHGSITRLLGRSFNVGRVVREIETQVSEVDQRRDITSTVKRNLVGKVSLHSAKDRISVRCDTYPFTRA